MLGKLSKSRKKIKDSKQIQSKNKKSKGKLKEGGKKNPPKPSHQHSVNSLLIRPHNQSQCSLVSQPKKILPKRKTKNHESSMSLLSKPGIEKQFKIISKEKRNSMIGRRTKQKNSPNKNSNKFAKKKEQIYEIVNVQMCKSKTHSQINFSNDSSVRVQRMQEKENIKGRRNLTIQCSDEYILNQYFSNSRIKNHNRQKVEAAIKIQKVFRGYLSRKMLQQFIQKEEEKLRKFSNEHRELFEREKDEQSPDFSEEEQDLEDIQHQEESLQDFDESDKGQESDIFKSSEILLDQRSDQNSNFKNQIVHHPQIQQQSSIYPQENQSISKYLPQELLPSANKRYLQSQQELDKQSSPSQLSQSLSHEKQMQEEQIIEDRPYLKNEGQKYISFDQIKYKMNQEKSQDAKHTPKLSTQLEKNEPIVTDFSQKKISQFHSAQYYEKSRQKKLSGQYFPSQQKENDKNISTQISDSKTKNIIKKIKKEEKEKWNHVIDMLNEQITQTVHKNADMMNFMKVILDFSKKNKEDLESSFLNVSKNKEFQESSLNISAKKEESRSKKKNLRIQVDISPMRMQLNNAEQLTNLMERQAKQRKNEDLPLIIKKNLKEQKSLSNIFEKTQHLKKFLNNNMFNYPIQEMIYIREKALEKKEKVEVDKINLQLYNEDLTEEQFIERLQEIQTKFLTEKDLISEAKQQIMKGYKATHKLIQDSYIDARILGFNLPFSKSMQQIKGNNWISEIIVDQIKSIKSKGSDKDNIKKKPLNISLQESSLMQNQSSSLVIGEEISYNEGDLENHNLQSNPSYFFEDEEDNSSEQPIGQFKKVTKNSSDLQKKYNSQLLAYDEKQIENTLENIIILNKRRPKNEQKMQENVRQKYKNFSSSMSYPKSEVYRIDIDGSSSSSEELLFNQSEVDPNMNEVIQHQIVQLIWEVTAELYESNKLKSHLCFKKNQRVPEKISNQQRQQFVDVLIKQIPQFSEIKNKINQKMTPSNFQLLKHMRVTFNDSESSQNQDDDEEFEEIGKYQMILSQVNRMSSIQNYMAEQSNQNSLEKTLNNQKISEFFGDKLPFLCIKKVIERQKALAENLKQRQDLRNQIKKIQLHCIFDAVNEILIKLRMKKVGYSGIGLNQLSSLFSSKGIKPIESAQQFQQLKNETESSVKELVKDDKGLKQKLMMENYEQFYLNDSQWILYSDEALSFALQLGFLIEDELLCEGTDQISFINYKRKI